MLLATYTFHRKVTSDIVDAPTVRILGFMLDDLHTQIAEGEMMVRDLARDPQVRRRAGDWQTHLDVLLGGSHGVAGEGTLGTRACPTSWRSPETSSSRRTRWRRSWQRLTPPIPR